MKYLEYKQSFRLGGLVLGHYIGAHIITGGSTLIAKSGENPSDGTMLSISYGNSVGLTSNLYFGERAKNIYVDLGAESSTPVDRLLMRPYGKTTFSQQAYHDQCVDTLTALKANYEPLSSRVANVGLTEVKVLESISWVQNDDDEVIGFDLIQVVPIGDQISQVSEMTGRGSSSYEIFKLEDNSFPTRQSEASMVPGNGIKIPFQTIETRIVEAKENMSSIADFLSGIEVVTDALNGVQ